MDLGTHLYGSPFEVLYKTLKTYQVSNRYDRQSKEYRGFLWYGQAQLSRNSPIFTWSKVLLKHAGQTSHCHLDAKMQLSFTKVMAEIAEHKVFAQRTAAGKGHSLCGEIRVSVF